MKRRKLTAAKTNTAESSDSGSVSLELSYADDESTQVNPGVVVVDGCQIAVRNAGEEWSDSFPPVAELSLNETGDKFQDGDFNDRFPDEILQSIFKYIWRPVRCWEAAKVCKRWYVLLARNELQKRSNRPPGRYPCTRLGKNDQGGKEPRCNGSGQTLKMAKIESEWKLSKDLLTSCRRHTHTLEIKDCTHVSVRGYQLIAAFVSNLKSIRLESCNSMDDPSLDVILDRCRSLWSLYLCMAPELTLRNVDKKAPFLKELHVYGCPKVTATTVFSVLRGCPNLRTLSLSAVGVSHDWDESTVVVRSPLRLQNLKLANTLAVTDAFLQVLTESLPNLRTLSLTHCPLLSDGGLQPLILSCARSLQRLVVTFCPAISDDTVLTLAHVGANLKDLSLAGTNASDDGIEALTSSDCVASKLRNLSVASCPRITDAGLRHLVSGQNRLLSFKTIDVQNCPGVSSFALQTLRDSMKNTAFNIISDKDSLMVSE